MICQKCGSQMNDGAAFCSKCGAIAAVSLKKPFKPEYGKAPEYGKQLSPEDNLDPHYKKVDLAVGMVRWAFCILWIIECFKGNSGIIVMIIISALCIYFTSLMEKLVMLGYEYLRMNRFRWVKYSSYIDTSDSETIAYLLEEPLSALGIGVTVREKCPFGNMIDLEYQGREYGAAFVADSNSYFMIVCNNTAADKYEKMCKDVPFIVYNIQSVLKNL